MYAGFNTYIRTEKGAMMSISCLGLRLVVVDVIVVVLSICRILNGITKVVMLACFSHLILYLF